MTIGCFQEVDYDQFGKALLERIGGQRAPLSGGWDVTERCNLDCGHCYIRQPPGDVGRASRELSKEQIGSIFEQAAGEGCLWFLFTGGEPFLRPDFMEIYRYAKRCGLLPTLFSNGTLLTPGLADELLDWRPHKIEITLYGATQETYERVTRVPGSYSRFRRGLDLLLERGLPLGLKAILMRTNRHELEAMKAFAHSLSLEFRYDAMITPRIDGGMQPLDLRVTPEEIVAYDLADPERVAVWKSARSLETPETRSRQQVYFCGAGLRSFHIDAYGRMSACGLARLPSYDLVHGTFREGWRNFLSAVRNTSRVSSTPCVVCDAGSLCLQCPGWSQLVHADNESPVDHVCRVGKLRLQALS
jgi:radical SAM protein with 4Fe4S-binding SPASM domain